MRTSCELEERLKALSSLVEFLVWWREELSGIIDLLDVIIHWWARFGWTGKCLHRSLLWWSLRVAGYMFEFCLIIVH